MRFLSILTCLTLFHTHGFASEIDGFAREGVVPKYEKLGVFFLFLEELQRTGRDIPPNRYEDALKGAEGLVFIDGCLCRRNPDYTSPEKKLLWDDESDTQSDASSYTSDRLSDEENSNSGKTSHEISLDFDNNEPTKSTEQDTYIKNQDPNSPIRKRKRLSGKITDYFSSRR